MQELVFLLVLMVMTGLGVRLLLMQLDGQRPRLPRLALPQFSLPALPRRRRRTARAASASAYEPVYEEDDLDQFAASRSPFSVMAPAPILAPVYEEDEEEDDELYEEDEASLPASQIDFFAERVEAKPTLLRAPAQVVAEPAGYEAEHDPLEATEALPSEELLPDELPPAESDPLASEDPNDLMKFFEKPAVTTQLPETLRDAVEPVSASEILAEARQISMLIRGRRRSA